MLAGAGAYTERGRSRRGSISVGPKIENTQPSNRTGPPAANSWIALDWLAAMTREAGAALEPDTENAHLKIRRREPSGSRGTAKEYEDFARDCVRLANQADSPEVREKLLNLAREWMHAVMDVEDAATPKSQWPKVLKQRPSGGRSVLI